MHNRSQIIFVCVVSLMASGLLILDEQQISPPSSESRNQATIVDGSDRHIGADTLTLPNFFETDNQASAQNQQGVFADEPNSYFTSPESTYDAELARNGKQHAIDGKPLAKSNSPQKPSPDGFASTADPDAAESDDAELSSGDFAQSDELPSQQVQESDPLPGLGHKFDQESDSRIVYPARTLRPTHLSIPEKDPVSNAFEMPEQDLLQASASYPQPPDNQVRFAFNSNSSDDATGLTVEPKVRQVQNQSLSGDTTSETEEAEAEQLGVPPPKRTSQFVKRNSVLLEPGRYQFEYGIRYSVDTTTSPVAGISNTENSIVEILNATQKRQLFSGPLEFRVGLLENLQGFMSIPIGWSGRSVTAGNSKTGSDAYGIGDLGLGLTRVMWAPEKSKTRILGFLQASAPTGDDAIALSQQSRNAGLGAGYWTLTAGGNMSQSLDPVVLFGSLGYTYTFSTRINSGERIDVGNTFFYRTGVGYAINPNVTISASFSGASTGSVRINDQKIPAARTEPFSLRIAGSINSPDKKKKSAASKNYEPFLRYGLTSLATDVEFGIRWTY